MKTKIIAFVISNYYKIAFGIVGAGLVMIGSVLDSESQYLIHLSDRIDHNDESITDIKEICMEE